MYMCDDDKEEKTVFVLLFGVAGDLGRGDSTWRNFETETIHF